MGDGSSVVTTGTGQNQIRRVRLDRDTLRRVAEALGIPDNERDQFISDVESIHIFRRVRPANLDAKPRSGRAHQSASGPAARNGLGRGDDVRPYSGE